LAVRFVPVILSGLIVQKLKLLAQDDGVRAHRDVRDGADSNFSVARAGWILAVVPLAS
jgi:hypothetical protein